MKIRAKAGLSIDCVLAGPLATNCYVLSVAGSVAGVSPAAKRVAGILPARTVGVSPTACWVIDPGDDAPVLRLLARKDLSPQRILLTHGHGDHIGGVAGVKRAFPQAVITAPRGDAGMLTDPAENFSLAFGTPIIAPPAEELLDPGATLELGQLRWDVLDVAGHTRGGLAFYCAEAGVVVTGDALFAGSIGRTDLPGGDTETLLSNIRNHLLNLPGETLVLPGHGSPTTIANELANPFLDGDAPC
jgi:glyoxylase-like metal-dependent hydrolase (beta-lactamase superfamily II)